MLRLSSLVLLASVAAAAAAQPTYSLTLVHESPYGARANVVNDAGLVGGSVSVDDRSGIDPSEAFLWQDGAVVWQGSLGVSAAGVGALTEAGDATGNAVAPEAPYSGEFAAFFRPAGGAIVAAPAPPISGYRQVSYHGGISESGLAPIRYRVRTAATGGTSSPPYHVGVWDTAAGTVTPLPHLSPDSLYARAVGIAADGTIGGAAVPPGGDIIHAVRWVPDGAGGYTIEDLGTLDGGTYSEVNAINAAGVMFGEATSATNGNAQPARWEPDGTGRILPMPPGATGCGAYDLSDTGIGVGWCGIDREPRATAWIGDQPHVLQDHLDASADGWTLTRAYGVNSLGWIVGVGEREGFVDSEGNPEQFGFLLRPAGSVASEADPAGVRPLALAVAPSPTRGPAAASFRLGTPAHVTAEVFDVRGRRVRTLLGGPLAAGPHRAVWDGRDASGRAASPGVYAVRVRAGRTVAAARLVVVR